MAWEIGLAQVAEQLAYLPLRAAICRHASPVTIDTSRMRFRGGDKR
jgi:hypothetical protein